MATVRQQIGPTDRGRRMALAEFRELDRRGGYRYELARGVLIVTNIPRGGHPKIVDNVHEAISTYRRANPGRIYWIGRGSDVRYKAAAFESDRHPDLAVLFRGAPRDADGVPLPTLAVGVVSRGKRARRRDYEEKRQEYLAVGLLEYWIVDPDERRVTVLVRREAERGPAWEERTFGGEEVIAGDLLPGFVGTVAGLWRDLDDAP